MNLSNKLFLTGALALTFVSAVSAQKTDSYFEVSKNLEIFNSVVKELNTYYVDPIEPGKMTQDAIDAMLENLDPYTNYITESDIEEYEFQTTGKYGGIGATMRKKGDIVLVGDVYEYSPAQKAGLHPGDVVVAIDGQTLAGKSIDDISTLLKGSPGTQVMLKVKDIYTNEEATKIVTRGEIELSSVPYAGLFGEQKKVAYVKLNQFTPGCARLVRQSLDSLKKAEPNLNGVVLDLRNNPGGLLNEAVDICNLFIDRGQLVVFTKGKMKDWDSEFKTNGAPWDTKIPVTVLINQSSASASEIVAGTLQDLDRGVIIGERSYGKGLVQTTRPLGYNARLKLTTAKYYTPSGRCIQALDYSHRNPDGSVGEIPDSLKNTYTTQNGRKVQSGGGVEPDIKVEDKDINRLAVILYAKNYLFDYATKYAQAHKDIAPAETFSLSNEEYNQFVNWVADKDYSYKSDTEIMLDSLKQIAVDDKYFDEIKAEYNAMLAKVSHDKKQDLQKHKEQIKDLLENEIVSRYYYLRGRIAHSLQDDNDLQKALNIINKPSEYSALLQPKK